MAIGIYQGSAKKTKQYLVKLVDSGNAIELIVVDEEGHEYMSCHLLSIDKRTGMVTLYDGVNPKFGFDTNDLDRLKLIPCVA